jgi:hypothetical protein
MVVRTADALPALYEADETAWLEVMADLVRNGRYEQLDYVHLAEYLSDMAKRDKREVQSRLATLIAHLLKWKYQAENRTRSWRGTILVQQHELEDLLESGVLRNHAAAVLPLAYAKGLALAVAETGLPGETFPAECPYTVDELLSAETSAE